MAGVAVAQKGDHPPVSFTKLGNKKKRFLISGNENHGAPYRLESRTGKDLSDNAAEPLWSAAGGQGTFHR
ncbi:MAG: hypothetical protein HYY46_14595 [Deltaproteobacteria bacterium]|nr:hypothetical protein [Deltaproteobacteria bacterium]